MASCDSNSLEFWIEDSVYGSFTYDNRTKMLAELVDLLEPYRTTIENLIDSYDEETQSWRTYRNMLWDYISEDDSKTVDMIANKYHNLR